MKALVCELCNSNELVKENGVYICKHCGTQYSVEEAKKLLVEGTVSIDNSQTIDNYLSLARRARKEDDTQKAERYYSLVLELSPDDWEANFFSVYFRSMDCVIANIASSCNAVSNVLPSTFNLILKKESDLEKAAALKLIGTYCTIIAAAMRNASISHYNGIDASIRNRYNSEKYNRCCAAANILVEFMLCMEKARLKSSPILAKNMTVVASNLNTHADAINVTVYERLINLWIDHDAAPAREYKAKYVERRIENAKTNIGAGCILIAVFAILAFIGYSNDGHLMFTDALATSTWAAVLFWTGAFVTCIAIIYLISKICKYFKEKSRLENYK